MASIVVVSITLFAAMILQSFALLLTSIASAAVCVVVLFGLLSYQEYQKISALEEKTQKLTQQLGN